MNNNSCTKIPFGIMQVSFYVTLVIIITIIINYINLKEYVNVLQNHIHQD